ncbi:MAG TPA: biotin--[acetyl-CoA-carboxylase] ligase [Bacteroidales bacterium]
MSELFKNSHVIKLPKVESTNTYITKLQGPLIEGSVVWALEQTGGRGQGSNKWESEPNKNLTFSIVLNPTFLLAQQQFYMSKVLALAVTDFVSLHTDNVSIKWPNDVFAGDKKIAGILIENSIEKTYLKQTIGGIGINLNQAKFTSSASNPVSLTQLTGKKFDIEDTLSILIELISYRYLMLKNKDFRTIDSNFNDSLYRFKQPANYITDGKIFEGIIQGVKTTGELLIKDKAGKIHKFLHKEVEFVL